MNWALVLPLLGVVIAPVLTYLVARRTTSGRVNTTEASTLWEEAERMRKAYSDRADRLEANVAELLVEVRALRQETIDCQHESALLRAEVVRLGTECERLRVLHEQGQALHVVDEKKLQAEKDKP